MDYKILFRDEAYSEINAIYDWYEFKSRGLGKFYLEELEKCLDNIRPNPFLFEKKYKKFRQALTTKFPYLIIFEIEDDSIIIYHVIHASRNPGLKFRKKE